MLSTFVAAYLNGSFFSHLEERPFSWGMNETISHIRNTCLSLYQIHTDRLNCIACSVLLSSTWWKLSNLNSYRILPARSNLVWKDEMREVIELRLKINTEKWMNWWKKLKYFPFITCHFCQLPFLSNKLYLLKYYILTPSICFCIYVKLTEMCETESTKKRMKYFWNYLISHIQYFIVYVFSSLFTNPPLPILFPNQNEWTDAV